MTRMYAAAAVAAALVLAGCAKDDEPVPAPVYLLDQRWMLTEIDGEKLTAPAGSPTTYLTLSSVGGTNQGQSFCNQYGGQYTLASGTAQLTFGPQFSTFATCPSQHQETRYLTLLPSIARYTIENRQLALYDATHPEPRLVFRAAE
ncbi:META domain-containing protein [Hymenobacter pini]|uniref:META domain-containing protein n=1 Tax=Hymenobacter pini TaxID=2880879 RepID=UPI001CF43436|nr:META domain-containing protein [Hymenobacter pini]MCA8832017.1 META domain-containing protein [Hymenobacter pini]